ncbi:MAG: DNA-directed RNA polymerase subunit alpha [Epsilonproteobacteria bacterium]|nr:MAG: DNA-directed RNA polymerase subunit alpha [Campylobacterota bacterium]
MSKNRYSLMTAEHVEVEELDTNKAKISVYPFETGHAITLAHPLRRLLMSSSVGFAPIAVKIENIAHEFDSLKGMVEDAALFILNLKALRFKIKDETCDEITVDYNFNKAMSIIGDDLNTNDIEIVNGDMPLATINDKCDLNFTLIIQKGIAYTPSEDTRDMTSEEFIPLDAFFTPVQNVVYDIQKVLVDDNPNFEKIIFTIKTDGQITPIDAMKKAVNTMNQQMSVFNKIFHLDKITSTQNSNGVEIDTKVFMQNISELELSARSYNSLKRAGLKYVGQIVLMSEVEVENINNLGKKSLEELSDKMKDIGYPIDETLDELIAATLKKYINETIHKKG